MSLRPGIDFVIAGAAEFAALVCVVDRTITLHQDDPRVASSKYFTLAPCAIKEPKGGGPAAIRFGPRDWCEKAQKARPREIRIVTAERGMKIVERAEELSRAGLSVADAVKRAYSDVTGQIAVEAIDVATFKRERERLLARLSNERAIDLYDQTRWGHLTNDNLRTVLNNPLSLDSFEPQVSEAPTSTDSMTAEERERREIYDFLRANGVKVQGWPGLAKLREMRLKWESDLKAQALAELESEPPKVEAV